MNTIYFPIATIDEKPYSRPRFNKFIFDNFNMCFYDDPVLFGSKIPVEITSYSPKIMLKFEFTANINGKPTLFKSEDVKDIDTGKYYIEIRGFDEIEIDVLDELFVQDLARTAKASLLMAMDRIMSEGMKRQVEWKASPNTKRKYSREHRISTANNKIYLYDDIVRYVAENYTGSHGSHKVTCPCWEVRGHYRHYKSGKVVFVPAYRKGKQKDKVVPIPHEYYAKAR